MSQNTFPLRGPVFTGLLAVLVLVGGFGTWGATTKISGAIIASGQIEVDQNRQVVQHPDGGVVAEILVDEGDVVAAGDVLIRLDPTLLLSELTIIDDQLSELRARKTRMMAERDGQDTLQFPPELDALGAAQPEVREIMVGQTNLFQARRDTFAREVEQLGKRREQIKEQITGMEAQERSMGEMLALTEAELSNQEKLLQDGLTQASRVLDLQRETARLQGSLGEMTAQKAEAEGRIIEIELQALNLENQRREEAIATLRDVQTEERGLAEQGRALRERLSRMEITTPVSGVVYSLSVFAERAVIRPADPVLFVVPQDRPLVIAAQVEPIHIDQLFVDQDVTLRFSALDQRKTPELFGKVVQISADAFEDQTSKIRYYRAEVVLKDGEIARLPKGSTLIPGMPVETFIRTEDRTPLTYLVKPFTDYFAKAFRES